MGIPKGQDIHIVFATSPDNMTQCFKDQGALHKTGGINQVLMLQYLKNHISGTLLDGHVFAVPMPVDSNTSIADVDMAIAHLDSQLAKGSRVMTLENEDCSPGKYDYAYGLSQGKPKFTRHVIDHIQNGLAKLDHKYAAGAAAAAPSPVTSYSSGAAARASSGPSVLPVFPAGPRPGAAAAFGASASMVATTPSPSKGLTADHLKILDVNGKVDPTASAEAVKLLKDVIKQDMMEIVPAKDIASIPASPSACSILDSPPYNQAPEGVIIRYKNGVGKDFQLISVEEIVEELKANHKFVCRHSRQDILKMGPTGAAVSCVGQAKTGNCPLEK
ncbi:hypothetical protein [Endozoicomonas elysicola]|uniref:Uncharacterized protein n=1 Tax=Endozoicomonas elysicola TaxID=305900 RepID=A0A081K735_9GAMM|nr:hypothetical protein [Endozoicomonas elysicola]KEI69961.1 hypothetical protein GV64_03660 [Endozoicomonas elysicola]